MSQGWSVERIGAIVVILLAVGGIVSFVQEEGITGHASFTKQLRKQIHKIEKQIQAQMPPPQAPVIQQGDTVLVETQKRTASFGTLPPQDQSLPAKALPPGVGV